MPRPRTPEVAADIIIELDDRPGRPIVIIERAHPPLGHALPGGFVDIGETVEHAAMREAREETGLEVTLAGLLGVYSDPARDPRGHTVAIVYVATSRGELRAGDDAAGVRAVDPEHVPPLIGDHGRIVADYLAWRRARDRRSG